MDPEFLKKVALRAPQVRCAQCDRREGCPAKMSGKVCNLFRLRVVPEEPEKPADPPSRR